MKKFKYIIFMSFLFLMLIPGVSAEEVGCGIFGAVNSSTVKLLSWAFKLIRFGIPIIIIVLGITDFLTILFSGEEKVYKDAFSRFAKRLLIGILVLFIPYIIYFIVRLSGVDKQYNIDNFYCGIIDTVSGVKGNEIEEETGEQTCYICQDELGDYSQHWTKEQPSGYTSCYILSGQTEDTCLHG